MAIWKPWLERYRRYRLRTAIRRKAEAIEAYQATLDDSEESQLWRIKAGLSLLAALPMPDYTYRVGSQMLLEVYVERFSQWQRLSGNIKRAMTSANEPLDPEWRQLGRRRQVSFDDYLDEVLRYSSKDGRAKEVLGAFRATLVGELTSLMDALRVTKDADDPGRYHYYSTRVDVLLRDGRQLIHALTSKAMEHLYDNEAK